MGVTFSFLFISQYEMLWEDQKCYLQSYLHECELLIEPHNFSILIVLKKRLKILCNNTSWKEKFTPYFWSPL